MPHPRQPERRRATIKDVARVAGVSPALVSLVLNDQPGASDANRAKVRAAADELGYRPDAHATFLRRRRANLLGVAFSVQSAFHGDLLQGIYAAAAATGYEVVLSGSTADRPEADAIAALGDFRCDALILLGPEAPVKEIDELAAQLPVVIIGRPLTSHSADTVRTDERMGMRLAVDYLASMGHELITHVDGGGFKGLERLTGYLEAMEGRGLAAGVEVIPGGETIEAGLAAGRTLLSLPGRRTSVIAYDDDSAWGLMTAFAEGGVSVPGDLSVVGYDGGRLSRLTPLSTLTTVRQDADGLARRSVERAISWIEGRREPIPDELLAPSLVTGGSTAPRPAEPGARHAAASAAPVVPPPVNAPLPNRTRGGAR